MHLVALTVVLCYGSDMKDPPREVSERGDACPRSPVLLATPSRRLGPYTVITFVSILHFYGKVAVLYLASNENSKQLTAVSYLNPHPLLPPVFSQLASTWQKTSGINRDDYMINPVSKENITLDHILAAEFIQKGFRLFLETRYFTRRCVQLFVEHEGYITIKCNGPCTSVFSCSAEEEKRLS